MAYEDLKCIRSIPEANGIKYRTALLEEFSLWKVYSYFGYVIKFDHIYNMHRIRQYINIKFQNFQYYFTLGWLRFSFHLFFGTTSKKTFLYNLYVRHSFILLVVPLPMSPPFIQEISRLFF